MLSGYLVWSRLRALPHEYEEWRPSRVKEKQPSQPEDDILQTLTSVLFHPFVCLAYSAFVRRSSTLLHSSDPTCIMPFVVIWAVLISKETSTKLKKWSTGTHSVRILLPKTYFVNTVASLTETKEVSKFTTRATWLSMLLDGCNGAHPLRDLKSRVMCARQAYTRQPRKR